MGKRVELDSLGPVEIPDGALWGPQTQRALENFAISGLRFGRGFIGALAHVKRASALANVECGVLDPGMGEAVARACDAVAAGNHDDQFPVDIFADRLRNLDQHERQRGDCASRDPLPQRGCSGRFGWRCRWAGGPPERSR